MALTCEIVAQPGGEQGVVLSKNPFLVKVRSEPYVIQQGVYYSHEWEVDDAGNNGAFLFTGTYAGSVGCTDTGGIDNILNYAVSGCASINEWLVEFVIPVLNNHVIFGKYWVWTAASTRLKATAKELYDTNYALAMTASGGIVLNELSEVASAPLITYTDGKVIMSVGCTTSMGSGSYATSEELTFDFKLNNDNTAGEVEVDLSSVLDSMIAEWDNLSNIDANGYRLEVMQRRAFVKVQCYFDAGIKATLKTKTVLVLKGGMRTNELAVGYLPWVGSDGVNPIGFITNKPKEVWCTKQTKNYLCWHNKWLNSSADTTIRYEVYYASGTSAGNVMGTIDNSTKGKYEVWSVKAGFNDLDIESVVPGAAVVKWEIRVEHLDSAWAIKQTYYLLPETDMGCTLVYRNALGVPDSIWCEGDRTTTVVHSKDIIDVGRGLNPTALTLREVSYGRSIKPSITVVTAPMQRNEWTSMLDILLSDEVRIHFPQTDTWVVGQIEPGSVEETTVNWAGANMVAMRLTIRLNEEAGWSVRTF